VRISELHAHQRAQDPGRVGREAVLHLQMTQEYQGNWTGGRIVSARKSFACGNTGHTHEHASGRVCVPLVGFDLILVM